MATFYGQVEGKANTTASRLGSLSSGITASVQSYDGSVTVELRYRGNTGKAEDLFITVWYSDGSSWKGDVIFDGPLVDFHDKFATRLHL